MLKNCCFFLARVVKHKVQVINLELMNDLELVLYTLQEFRKLFYNKYDGCSVMLHVVHHVILEKMLFTVYVS